MQEIEAPEEKFDYRTMLRPWVRKRLEEWERKQPDWLADQPTRPIRPIRTLEEQDES